MKKFLVFMLLLVLTFVGFACKKTDENKDVLPTSVKIKCEETTVEVGDTLAMKATVLPNDATNKSVNWSSSDTNVATVKNGTVTAVSEGSATITAECAADKNVKDSITIEVIAKQEKTPTPIITPTPGGDLITGLEVVANDDAFVLDNSFILTAIITPSTAGEDDFDLVWESSDEAIATVERKSATTAAITCNSLGTCVITVTDDLSELSVDFEVTVVDHPALAGIKLSNDREVQMPDTCVITVTPEPLYALYEVTWSSSDESIATVDENGKVTPVAEGTVVITATSKEGFTATCNIKVLPPFSDKPESVIITTGYEQVYVGYSVRFAAQVNPAGVNQGVVWTSNNEKVGVIDETGEFTALSIGTTRIRATSVVDDGVKG
ncbi:MAG: Ig-like domain-containing protein, partial [Bacilli bacterium]|nr:Ig-like domain-containing protein [Bacilli bacterium]